VFKQSVAISEKAHPTLVKDVTKDERVFVLEGCKNKLLLSFNKKILSALTTASLNCKMSFNKIKISENRKIQQKIFKKMRNYPALLETKYKSRKLFFVTFKQILNLSRNTFVLKIT
jgi:hypothetical protein